MTGPRLSIIPARAATDRALKPRDLQVLCVLGRHTDDLGWCTKSQVKMADEMGCARSTVFEAIERLVKAGYLERHVQEQANGRDAPHFYRVLLDPVHPNLGALKEADSGPEKATPPAGISAPPAGPEPAPPAGPGPAPKNDPFRTTHLNEDERERGREDEGQGQEAVRATAAASDAAEARRAVERGFERAWQAWPTSVSDSRPDAQRAWLGLTPDERCAATEEAARYVDAVKAAGRKHVISHAVYLREKRWTQLPAKPDPSLPTGPRLAKPWGPLWTELVLKALYGGAIELGDPPTTRETRAAAYLQSREMLGAEKAEAMYRRMGHDIADDGTLLFAADFEARIWREHVAAHGFPKVKKLYQAAGEGRSVALSDAYVETGAAFEPVPVGLSTWNAWRALFEARGWPWMPPTGKQPVVYFPVGGPEGLGEFEAALRGAGRVNEGEGKHADDEREAAE